MEDHFKVQTVKSFKLWAEDVSCKDLTICWETPSKISNADIKCFDLFLFRVGKTDTVDNIKNHREEDEDLVYRVQVDSARERCYSIFGLEPSCAYKAILQINFVSADSLTKDYTFLMGIRTKPGTRILVSNGEHMSELQPIQSRVCLFTTEADMDSVLLKKQEWEHEQMMKKLSGQKGMFLQNKLCKSEIEVARFSRVRDFAGNFPKAKHQRTEDDSDDSDDMCKQGITSEVLAARYAKDWRDFVETQKGQVVFGKRDKAERDKRIRRYILVMNAVTALEDIPPDEENVRNGKEFLGNKWGQGPFYSWNNNYLI